MVANKRSPDENHSPVSRAEFAGLMGAFGYFEPSPSLAIAVSGGPDSMALLLLAHEWASAQDGCVTALTVDHALRAESSAEAAQVARWCAAHGITHHTLIWRHASPGANLQARAREARYELLLGWCREHHMLHILTAHHRDDQAETLLLRFGRGSGVDGLSGMASIAHRHGARLLRPLLDIPKQRLLATLKTHGQPWLEDPSNRSPAHQRNQLRESLAQMDDALLSVRAVATTTAMARARSFLEESTAQALVETVRLWPEGYAQIAPETFCALHCEIRLRVLAACLSAIGGNKNRPRLEGLLRLDKEITAAQPKRRTFGGCILKPSRNGLLVHREPGAIAPAQRLQYDSPTIWDGRFRLALRHAWQHENFHVRALGTDGWRNLPVTAQTMALRTLPKAVIPTLPSLWRLEDLVSVPHIPYTDMRFANEVPGATCAAALCDVSFRPPKALAAEAFCWFNAQSSPFK